MQFPPNPKEDQDILKLFTATGPLRKPGTSDSTPLPTGSLQVAFPRLLV